VIFGQQLARELLEFSCEYPPPLSSSTSSQGSATTPTRMNEEERGEESTSQLQFRAAGYISNANYSMKTGTFMLFINNRLVGMPRKE